MENTNIINIVVWAENSENAEKLANSLSSEQSDQVYVQKIDNHELRTHLRYPNVICKTIPAGVTDFLIVHVNGENNDAKSYINQRKGIPFKFIVSSSNLFAFAAENGCEFVDESEVYNELFKHRVVKTWGGLETTLRSAFEKIDLNGNGFISCDELVKASAELGHTMNTEEAKIIISALSTDGNISYDQFKHWWIMGKGDLFSFRHLVKLELGLNHLVKQTSQAFNDYASKLQTESDGIANTKTEYKFNVNIGSSEEFENGLGIDADVAMGKEAEAVIETLPDYIKNSPITLGLELHARSADQSTLIHSTIEELKGILLSLPPLQSALMMGLEINTRAVDTSVFIDFTVSGMIAEQVHAHMSHFNVEAFTYTGVSNFQLVSGLKPVDLLNCDFEQLLRKLCQLKIQMNAEFSNIKEIVKLLLNTLNKTLPSVVKQKMLPMLILMNSILIIRELNYEFKYYVSDLVSGIKELMCFKQGEDMCEMVSQRVGQGQMMANMSLEPVKQMAGMFIGPYGEQIRGINLDKISVYYFISKVKAYMKYNINLPGLSNWVEENFLQ
jgi:hypothetical protein